MFGGRYRDLPNPGRRVGVLLDASAQHAGRRGREALAVSARTMGVPLATVAPLLKAVRLNEAAAARRVGNTGSETGERRAPDDGLSRDEPRPRFERRNR
jgi:hypothetical protein